MNSSKKPSRFPSLSNWAAILRFSLLAVVVYLLWPQLPKLWQGVDYLSNAQLIWLGVAIFCIGSSYVAASLVYVALSQRRLRFSEVAQVQIAVSFAGKFLPAGVAGMGMNVRFLTKRGHSLLAAATIMTMNNIIGFVASVGLFLLALVLAHLPLGRFLHLEIPLFVVWVGAVLALIMGFGVVINQRLRIRGLRLVRGLTLGLASYRKRPLRLCGALCAAVCLSLCSALGLYAVARSLGGTISVPQALIVVSVGVGVGVVIPIPGGLVGVEAGMLASLIALGLSAPLALAIVLSYRIISYWLPTLPGYIVFRRLQQQKII